MNGSDVIAVERADQGAGRTNLINRGKRSVAADLKTEEGRELVLRLIEDADVLIEGLKRAADVCWLEHPQLMRSKSITQATDWPGRDGFSPQAPCSQLD